MKFNYAKVIVNEGSEPLLRRVKCLAEQSFQPLLPTLLKKPQLIIFDYDNTLVDSWPQDFETSNEVFKALGCPPMDALEMLQEPHTPAVTAIIERTGLPYEKVKMTYNAIYNKIHQTIAPPLPGAHALLELIHKMGILTAVISNKEHDLLQDTLRQIGWSHYFHTFYGASPNKPFKPDPCVIDEIIKDLPHPVSKEHIFFVGDALSSDISCALQANVTPIWMSQYSVDEVTFSNAGPNILKVENCLALIDLLKVWI
jgi:phosphoglycolate phosphatase